MGISTRDYMAREPEEFEEVDEPSQGQNDWLSIASRARHKAIMAMEAAPIADFAAVKLALEAVNAAYWIEMNAWSYDRRRAEGGGSGG